MTIFLTFLKSLLTYKFIANSYRSAIRHFFFKYISLKYSIFNNAGVGSIQHSINKRAEAFIELVRVLSISLVSNLCFCSCVVWAMWKQLSSSANLKISVAVFSFLIFTILVHRKRAVLRNKINRATEANSSKAIDILLNYERNVSFDNIQIELDKYYKTLKPQVKYKQIYEVTYEIISFVNQAILILLACFILYEYNKSIAPTENILTFILISIKLKDVVYNISTDIDHLFVSHTNLSMSSFKETDYENYSKGVPISSFKHSIDIKNLCFSFNEKLTLKDISCQIKKGDKIAITGANGSGKSVFIKLLQGLLDYNGSIAIDGLEIRDINRISLLKLISYIPQSTFLLNKSVLKNLTDGNSQLTEKQIIEKTKTLNFHELFTQFGYDKDVGEQGGQLSGGQKQKLCFARAILSDAPIIIMDKACSSMDSKSELGIVKSIYNNMDDKTIINIVDGMINLDFYDQIFHFGDNGLLEIGNYKSLLKKKGKFYYFVKNIA